MKKINKKTIEQRRRGGENMEIEKIIKNSNYKIFYLYESYKWGAKHYSYSEVLNYETPSGSIIVRLTNFPYGHGCQWDFRETLIFVPKNVNKKVTAQMKYSRQDWALLEKRPEADIFQSEIELQEISTEKAVEIYNNYIKYSEDNISIEIQEVKNGTSGISKRGSIQEGDLEVKDET